MPETRRDASYGSVQRPTSSARCWPFGRRSAGGQVDSSRPACAALLVLAICGICDYGLLTKVPLGGEAGPASSPPACSRRRPRLSAGLIAPGVVAQLVLWALFVLLDAAAASLGAAASALRQQERWILVGDEQTPSGLRGFRPLAGLAERSGPWGPIEMTPARSMLPPSMWSSLPRDRVVISSSTPTTSG